MADTGEHNPDWNLTGSGHGTETGPGGSATSQVPPGSVVHHPHDIPAMARIIPGGDAKLGNTGTARLNAAAAAVTANPPADLADAIDHGYEPHDIGLRGVFNFLIGLIVTVVISLFIVWGIISALLVRDERHDPITTPMVIAHDPIPYPLQPSVQHDTVDHQDMEAMRAAVHEVLDSSGVTATGRHHISIQEAMNRVLSMLPIQPAKDPMQEHHG